LVFDDGTDNAIGSITGHLGTFDRDSRSMSFAVPMSKDSFISSWTSPKTWEELKLDKWREKHPGQTPTDWLSVGCHPENEGERIGKNVCMDGFWSEIQPVEIKVKFRDPMQIFSASEYEPIVIGPPAAQPDIAALTLQLQGLLEQMLELQVEVGKLKAQLNKLASRILLLEIK